jgi:hypothetical protein
MYCSGNRFFNRDGLCLFLPFMSMKNAAHDVMAVYSWHSFMNGQHSTSSVWRI